MPNSEDYKYWAFISYSHADSHWANWLHKAVETYRVPKRLVGTASRDGKIPPRLFPVFRDRDELPGSADLSDSITSALAQSRTLLVICSPRSAASRWVNEEVKTFKILGRKDRILCIIVDGEPNATDKPDSGLPECFPPAIRHQVSPLGGLLTTEPVEPIAADVRLGKDGKNNAKLKLLAGILGINYDDLKQRERRRRRQRLVLSVAVALLLGACFLGLWLRLNNLTAVEYAVEQGRQEMLAGSPQRALPYLNDAYLRGGSSPTLRFLLAQALQATDEHPTQIGDPDEFVQGLVFERNGHRFVTSGGNNSASVWDATTGRRLCRLTAHSGRVVAAAFSADGRRVVTAGGETARVWNAADGHLIEELTGHVFDVKAVVFSPDDTLLLTASADNTAKLWNAANGKLIRSLEGHDATVSSACFDADGRRILTASADNTAKLWETATGKLLATLQGHSAMLTRGFFSPDGTFAVTFSVDETARIWETASGRLLRTVKGFNGLANPSLVFEAGASQILVATATGGSNAQVWDLLSGSTVCTLVGHRGLVQQAELSRDGSRAVTASRDNTVKVWDAESGRLLTTFENIKGFFHTTAHFTPDGTRVLTEDQAGHAYLRDATNGRLRLSLTAKAASFTSDGSRLVTYDGGGTSLATWNATTGAAIASIDVHAERKTCKAISADGTRVLTAGPVAIEVRSITPSSSSGKTLLTLQNTPSPVIAAAFSPDDQQIAALCGLSEGRGNTILVWNAHTGALLWSKTPEKPGDGWTRLRFSADARLLWAGRNSGLDGWEALSGRPVCSFANMLPSDFHDDRIVASEIRGSMKNGVLRQRPLAVIYDARTGREIAICEGHSEGVLSAMFSPRGDLLVTAGDLTAKVWNCRDGRLLLSLEGHRGPVTGVCFNPDQTQIATVGWDGVAHIWDARDGKLLAAIETGRGVIGSVEFSPDGRALLTVGGDRTARLWSLPSEVRAPKEVRALALARTPWRLISGRLIAPVR